MFCHNCGAKLPEGAKFCVNCGTKVLNTIHENVGSITEVSRADNMIENAREQYFSLRAPFEENALLQAIRACNEYSDTVEDLDDFFQKFIPNMKKFWEKSIQMGTQMLIEHSVDYIDEKKIEAYIEEYVDKEPGVQDINQQYVELQQFGNQLAEETGDKTYWRGGGFGVSGAISGAVKAELMNIGTNALVNFGRFITGNSASAKMRRFKEKLSSEHNNYQNVMVTVRNINRAVFFYCYDILVHERQAQPVTFEPEKAQGKFNNLLQQINHGNRSYSKDEMQSIFEKCMQLDPYNIQFYTAAYISKTMDFDDLWDEAEEKGILPQLLCNIQAIDRNHLSDQKKKLAEHTQNKNILENAELIAFDDDELDEIFQNLEYRQRINEYMQENLDGMTLYPNEASVAEHLALKEQNEKEIEENPDKNLDIQLDGLGEYTEQNVPEFMKKTYIEGRLHDALNDDSSFKIFLVGGDFTILEDEENVTYIGVDDAEIEIDSDEYIDWEEKNVHFLNLEFDSDYQEIVDDHLNEKLEEGKNAISSQQYETAFSCFKYSALQDKNPEGMYQLGCCFLNGIGTVANTGRAMKCFYGADRLGEAKAAVILGRSYASGINGVNRDSSEAAYYYTRAINNDTESDEPYFYLGMMSLQRARSKNDILQTAEYLEGAADRGNLDAALVVANWCSRGVLSTKAVYENQKYYNMAYASAIRFGHNDYFGKDAINAALQGADSICAWASNVEVRERKNLFKYLQEDLNSYYFQHQYRPPTPDYFLPDATSSKETALANFQKEMQYCILDMQNWLNINSLPWQVCITPLKIIYWMSYGLLKVNPEIGTALSGDEYGKLLVNLQQIVQRMNLTELVAYIQNNSKLYFNNDESSPKYWIGDETVLNGFRALRHEKLNKFAQDFAGAIYNLVSPLQQALSLGAKQ